MSETNQEPDPVAEWEAMDGFTDAHDETRGSGRGLKEGGPPPAGHHALAQAPIIVDTDVGGDPDDAVALAVAALTVPELALVITSDEYEGFARFLLDLLGRRDVPVVAGMDLGNMRYFCVDDLTPPGISRQPTDVVGAVAAVAGDAAQPVRWVGMGSVSNMSSVLCARPDLARQLAVTQMGGALIYRDPTRAEHNFRLDPASARHVLDATDRIALVVSDVTFNAAIESTTASPIYRWLSASDAPDWARVLCEHMDHWFRAFYPGTIQHDSLALAASCSGPVYGSAALRSSSMIPAGWHAAMKESRSKLRLAPITTTS